MTFVCPRCGATRPPEEPVCGRCGFDIAAFESASYDDKLLIALFHPEPETSARAAYLLGFRRPPGAAEALERRYHGTDDPYLQREIVLALGRMGGAVAERVLADAKANRSAIVRAEVTPGPEDTAPDA